MNERERIIHLWFDMWLKQQDLGIDSIFTEDVIYTESWSPKYESRKTVKHWFDEWNTRGKVLVWDIKQFFHKENQTIVEWYFKNKMNNGNIEEFYGNYICLFDYLFISSQMSAKPYFIGSTGILLLW
jgi:hypothetical protein